MSRGIGQGRRLARGWALVALCLIFSAFVAGCGGGGGGGGGSLPIVGLPASSATTATTTTAAPATTSTTSPAATTTASASTPATGTAASAAASNQSTTNVVTIRIDTGPSGATGQVNIPYVRVTICPPGGNTHCQTIDHVIVDTGSSGLRILASALTDRSVLTAVTDGSGSRYGECTQFAAGYTWGSVKLASLTLGGETAASLPIQLIGDPDVGTAPASCQALGAEQDTVAKLGGKGLLGLGVLRQDCGSACDAAAIDGSYYLCGGHSGCSAAAMPLAQQVAQPVPFFAGDNNGVLIQLPAIGAAGGSNVRGQLVFGIGTRTDNAMGAAVAYGTDARGAISAIVDGQSYPDAFFDSGSNFLYFDSVNLPRCTAQSYGRFYCPSSATSLAVTVQGVNGSTGAFSLPVADAVMTLNGGAGNNAFNDVAAADNTPGRFNFGLPFFFGRNVFVAVEDASTPAGNGPFIGF